MEGQSFINNLLSLQENMFKFAYSLTMNKDDAQDLLQETSLRALKYQEKFSDGTNLKGWLFTIMKNIFINDYRKVVKTQTSVCENIGEGISGYSEEVCHENPEDLYDIHLIEKIIARLDEEMRKPFDLFMAGYRYEEIAEKTGLPMGTVKSRIYQTRQKLKSDLREWF